MPNAPALPATVAVPIDLLCEAIGYLDALDTLANNCGLSFGEHPASDALPDLVTELIRAAGVYDELEGLPDEEYDAAYDAHPLVVQITSHCNRVDVELRRLYDDPDEKGLLETALSLLTESQQALASVNERLTKLEEKD